MSFLRTVFVVLFVYPVRVVSQLQQRDTGGDSPLFSNPSNYRGHKWFATIVVGNYLYIDGGEIYYKDDNNATQHVVSQSTYSIDMSSSWTNATVSIKAIDKTSSIANADLDSNKLWRSLDNSSFYSYNGDKSWFYTPANAPSNKLYQFTSDGAGSGQWSEVQSFYTANSNFTALKRVSGSASTCSPKTCYAIGGYRNSRTDNALTEPGVPAAGIVSYDLTSQMWHNDTLVGSVFAGPWQNGNVYFTDIAGSEGIIVALGGYVSDSAGENATPIAFENVYLYDVATKTWYSQKTTGNIPSVPLDSYCTVGIRGDNSVNKTYEIFIHGGQSLAGSSLALDDVWVLSLPSFEWHKAGHTPVRGRVYHQCSIAGRRQMILVGGLDPDFTGADNDIPQDIWPLGLGVFDLSDMIFKNLYDANAPSYTSPKVVQKWYAENGPIARDVSDEVMKLFISSTSTGSTTTSSNTLVSSPSLTGNTSSSNGKSNAGAIAGGVVGGLVGIIAIVAIVWLSVRRRRRQASRAHGSRQPFETAGNQRFEAEGKYTHEVEAPQRHELL